MGIQSKDDSFLSKIIEQAHHIDALVLFTQ